MMDRTLRTLRIICGFGETHMTGEIFNPGDLIRPVGVRAAPGFKVRVISDNGCSVQVESVKVAGLKGYYDRRSGIRLERVNE